MSEDVMPEARILIVDDEESNVLLLEDLLRQSGYPNIKSTTESRRALPLFEEFRPDILLLDLMMPDPDGFAVMSQLKARLPADEYLPVLVLTADTTGGTRQRALAGGATDFLTKPLDLIETLQRIRNLLRARSLHLKLKEHNRTLEQMVRERTAALEKANEELRETQRVAIQQERLRALGQMASGVAHDINNALSPIMMYPEIMQQQETGLSEKGQKYLKVMLTAASDIEHTVSRMREFYRTREEQDNLCPVDLNAIAREVVDLTRPRWRDMPQKDGIEITIDTAFAKRLPDVPGVPSELREALTNLVLNAVDALPSGGVITIGTEVPGSPGATRGAGDAARVALWVQDTGIGMDEETRLRCLEPFFTKKGERGTGLGLAMVYGVMQRHGGEVQIESAPGRGSTFRLLFPLADTAAGRSATADHPAEYRGQPLRILYIDDEPMLREGVKAVLEGDGHTVTCAGDGAAGVEALRAAQRRGVPFQMVVTDLGMPRMDGREVAWEVKRLSPGTPVILLSGWGDQIRAEGRPEAVDRVLSKPPRVLDLRKALEDLGGEPTTNPDARGDADPADNNGKGTVLVMDDDVNNHFLAEVALRKLGCSVECTVNGAEAVDLYRRRMAEGQLYAAVFLDLNIPGGMGGAEAMKQLRQIDPAVKAFVASGADDDPVVRNYAHHGFQGVLHKPFRTEAIREALQGALGW